MGDVVDKERRWGFVLLSRVLARSGGCDDGLLGRDDVRYCCEYSGAVEVVQLWCSDVRVERDHETLAPLAVVPLFEQGEVDVAED